MAGGEPRSRRAYRRGISSAHDSGAWLAWVMPRAGEQPAGGRAVVATPENREPVEAESCHPVTETPGSEALSEYSLFGLFAGAATELYRRRGTARRGLPGRTVSRWTCTALPYTCIHRRRGPPSRTRADIAQGPAVAWSCQRLHDSPLRSPQDATRRLVDIPGAVLRVIQTDRRTSRFFQEQEIFVNPIDQEPVRFDMAFPGWWPIPGEMMILF